MEYLKQLKTALMFGGFVLAISLLNNLSVEFYGWLGAFLSFLIMAIHDTGKKYLELTNQSEIARNAFELAVNPPLAIICIASFFYVCVGEMVWYFWALAFFIALVMFAVDASKLIDAVKKSRN
jgi:hypothetical protein